MKLVMGDSHVFCFRDLIETTKLQQQAKLSDPTRTKMIFVKFLLVTSMLLLLWLSYPSPPASPCKEAGQVHQVQVVPPGLACRTGCHLAPLLQQVDCDVLGMEEVGLSWLLLVTGVYILKKIRVSADPTFTRFDYADPTYLIMQTSFWKI